MAVNASVSADKTDHRPHVSEEPVLCVQNLSVGISKRGHGTNILKNVSFSVNKGEILGLVGESGSGKSALAKTIVRLESPFDIISGTIRFRDSNLANLKERELRKIRGRHISLVMQNPHKTMDPVFTMGYQLKEVVRAHELMEKQPASKKSLLLSRIHGFLKDVGISSPDLRLSQYPHEWSRGMIQRAQLIMGFSVKPDLLILDEVTSALDPTICLQILDIILRLRKSSRTGIILITHDLSVVREICDRVAVMKNGEIVETGTLKEVFEKPCHPYTKRLVAAVFEDEGDVGK
ncbi:MAG: ABC transporter ATP-binding protein [Proteobacteria bacterium]|nr:ABC transporter ATP-binding protein [Pseudomonadota bacterium]